MLYNNFYETGPEWIRQQTREGVKTTHKPIYSGLFVSPMTRTALDISIKAALDGGASGVALFSADAMDNVKWRALGTMTAIPVKK
jgi:hypothetical protein